MGYVKVTLVGTMGTQEIWNTGACYNIVGIGTHSISFAMAQSIAVRLNAAITATTLPAPLRVLMSEFVQIAQWRVEGFNDTDVVTGVGVQAVSPALNGVNSATKTPQDALVFSLRTNHAGRNGRGRMYWPALGATLNGEYKLSSPTPATVALGAATLLDLIGDQINAELAANSLTETVELCVRSKTDKASYRVGSIQVGNVLDTQRRRRNRLAEAYVSQAYPLP